MPPRPFTIDVPQPVLDDLKQRLANTRWPEPLPGPAWSRGADLDYIREVCEYWRTLYDWRKHEADLNRYPQFRCEVDGVDLHFWHVGGVGPKPFPLILVHGWPGSMYEFHHLIGPLSDPARYGGDPADAFDVVVPALPGYGWSGKPQEEGWGPTRIARAFDTLMAKELGYGRYGTQGGDWGGIVTARMGANHADHIAGVHLNFITGQAPAQPTDADMPYLQALQQFVANETGYSNLQGTKPQSLGIAQTDSPAGIAAWIVEKFRTWSDCDGDIEQIYTKDQLLTNVMFYWAPNSIPSAAHLYYEVRRDAGFGPAKIEVPVGVAAFPKELYRPRREWLAGQYNVTHWTDMPRGGHFAAMEQPDLLLADIRAFFRSLR